MTLGMMNTSCKDMLTPDSERHAYEVAKDTLYSYWGILKSLQNIAERYDGYGKSIRSVMEQKDKMSQKEAIIETMDFAFPTILTSGIILAASGFILGQISSEGTIVGIGQSIGRIHEIKSCKAIIEDTVAEAEATLRAKVAML